MDREKVIKRLEALQKSILEHQCYTCSYEFIETVKEFGTNIIADAIALLKEQETANFYKCPNCGTWVSAENVVRCEDCRRNNECSIQFKFAPADNPGDWFCGYGKPEEGQ